MSIRDRNINWKYGYKYYRARDFDSLSPTAATSSLHLTTGGPVAVEINSLELSGVPMTLADTISHAVPLWDWDLDRNNKIEFNVLSVHTTNGADAPGFVLSYQFRSPGEALVEPETAPDEAVTLVSGANVAVPFAWQESGWGAMDTPTYISATDNVMQFAIEYDDHGGGGNDELFIIGVGFRYTREATTQLREQTTAG